MGAPSILVTNMLQKGVYNPLVSDAAQKCAKKSLKSSQLARSERFELLKAAGLSGEDLSNLGIQRYDLEQEEDDDVENGPDHLSGQLGPDENENFSGNGDKNKDFAVITSMLVKPGKQRKILSNLPVDYMKFSLKG